MPSESLVEVLRVICPNTPSESVISESESASSSSASIPNLSCVVFLSPNSLLYWSMKILFTAACISSDCSSPVNISSSSTPRSGTYRPKLAVPVNVPFNIPRLANSSAVLSHMRSVVELLDVGLGLKSTCGIGYVLLILVGVWRTDPAVHEDRGSGVYARETSVGAYESVREEREERVARDGQESMACVAFKSIHRVWVP